MPEPEGERVRYGLTKNLESHNPIHVAFQHVNSDIPAPSLAVGWIPQEVAADPETVILLTAAVSAIGARLAAWYAPRNGAPA